MKALKLTLAAIQTLGVVGYIFQVLSTRELDMKKAPVLAKGTIVIKASPEKVFKQLADINHWNTWLTEVSQAKLNGPLLPKSTFDWTTGGMKIHSILQKVNPYSALGWTGKVYGIYAIHNWEFKNLNGNTQVSVAESMQGLLAGVFSGYFNKTLKKDMQASLVLLKKTCEQEATNGLSR